MWPLLPAWFACSPGPVGDPAVPPTGHSGATDGWPPEPGNVLLVVLDDVGLDKVGAYGLPGAPPTPTLDALAARGMRFQNAWATPECSPSRAALLTGRHPRRSGIGGVVSPRDLFGLPESEVTLAERLGQAGYATALVGKWHLSPVTEAEADAPLRQGFGVFRGTLGNLQTATLPGAAAELPLGYWLWQGVGEHGLGWVAGRYATSTQVDQALEVAAGLPEPWLLVLPALAAHSPWDPVPAGLRDGPPPPAVDDAGRYDQVLGAFDRELGRLLDGLDPEVRARTTVIVISDNGTPGPAVRPPHDPLRSKGTPFEAGVRVPLIVEGPGVAAPGAVSEALVSVVDLWPTLTALAGVSDDGDGVARDGRSFLPALRDPSWPGAREVLYTEKFRPNGPGPWEELDLRVVRDRTHRLIRSAAGRELLFRLRSALDDGPELLAAGPLSPEDAEALSRLRTALDTEEAALGLR